MSVKFPSSKAMIGPFEVIREACKERPDFSDEALHAVTINNFASVLGRRIFLKDDPPVYPSLYNIIVGTTGDARKSQVTKLGKAILKAADENVIRQNALATPEGLINLFVFPNRLYPGCDIDATEGVDGDYESWFNDLDDRLRRGLGRSVDTFTDEYRNLSKMVESTFSEEGFRCQLVQNELSALLKKSRKVNGEGIIETLTEFYDMEDVVESPTKTNPTIAYYPCLNIVATTTKAWIEKNMTTSDIHGGFINRFGFYTSAPEYVDEYIRPPIDMNLIGEVVKSLAGIRSKWTNDGDEDNGNPINCRFSMTDSAIDFANQWMKTTAPYLRKFPEDISDAAKRFDLHAKKLSLIYSAIMNEPGDREVHQDAMEIACAISEYHLNTAIELFGEFEYTDVGRLERKILQALVGNNVGTYVSQLKHHCRQNSIEEVNKAIESLVKADLIHNVAGDNRKPQYVLDLAAYQDLLVHIND